jgi:hypothetical protein
VRDGTKLEKSHRQVFYSLYCCFVCGRPYKHRGKGKRWKKLKDPLRSGGRDNLKNYINTLCLVLCLLNMGACTLKPSGKDGTACPYDT